MTKTPTDLEIEDVLQTAGEYLSDEDIATLRAALAAAENRGFREAAEWLEEKNGERLSGGPSVFSACIEWACVNGGVKAIRAEADRREGIKNNNAKPEDGGRR